MSMIGNFRAVRDDDIGAMLERPARVVRLLYDEAPVESGGLLGRLMGRSGSSPEEDEWRPTAAGEELDVDKAWHGIHFLLTGTAWASHPPLYEAHPLRGDGEAPVLVLVRRLILPRSGSRRPTKRVGDPLYAPIRSPSTTKGAARQSEIWLPWRGRTQLLV
jgi:hypothetical protein